MRKLSYREDPKLTLWGEGGKLLSRFLVCYVFVLVFVLYFTVCVFVSLRSFINEVNSTIPVWKFLYKFDASEAS